MGREEKRMVPCEVCARAPAPHLLPERAPRELGDGWACQALCPLCLDALLGLFPLRPQWLARREITGR